MQPHHAVITDTQSLALRACVAAPAPLPMGTPVDRDSGTAWDALAHETWCEPTTYGDLVERTADLARGAR